MLLAPSSRNTRTNVRGQTKTRKLKKDNTDHNQHRHHTIMVATFEPIVKFQTSPSIALPLALSASTRHW